ncbi:hypothetical protein FRC06_001161 [Ceratobasidium sp. 370]|nr:hypothetical protein FRC06_001161 [Ceratobasidium sp. 370]
MPASRSVSEIPTLPSVLSDVPVSYWGKMTAAANIMLATIIKAGGKAQTSMTEGPSTEHGLRILGQLMDDTSQGIEALADVAVATGNGEVYRQMTEVRANFRATIYHILRKIDHLVEREVEAGYPAEAIPTDNFAVARMISDFRETYELDMEMFQAEMRARLEALEKKGENAPPQANKTSATSLSWRANTPKTQPPPKTNPIQPPKADKGKGKPVPAAPPKEASTLRDIPPPENFNWADEDTDIPMGEPPVVDFGKYTGNEGPTTRIDDENDGFTTVTHTGPAPTGMIPGAVTGNAANTENENDGFQVVQPTKNKGKARVSYAAAASKAPQGPVVLPKAANIANAIRATAKQQVPIIYTVLIPNNVPGPALAERLAPHQMYQRANNAIKAANLPAQVLQAAWNKKGNLVIHFPHATGPDAIEKAIPVIQKALAIPKEAEFRRSAMWSKVVLSLVPTGLDHRDMRYTSDELREELLNLNPGIMQKVEITQAPRWITWETVATKRTLSSLTFAFEDDSDGNVMVSLLSSRLWMFGMQLKVAKWNERPLLKGTPAVSAQGGTRQRGTALRVHSAEKR